jgi:muconate cycloisomerase
MIRSVEVTPYALPFRRPYVTARGRLDRREMVLLRIASPDGLSGLGEAVPLSLRGGTGLETVAGELETWGLAVTEGELPAESAPANLSAPARCAIETALSDLAAREAEVPLHEFLQPGRPSRPVPCNATLTTDTPAGILAQAENWAADGFTVFKLKLGTADDLAGVEAVRGGLGPEARIRLDANGSWDLDRAAEILAGLEPLGIELAEQPVADLESMAALKKRTSVPLVADESVSNPAEAKTASRLAACDAVTVKLSKVGGLDAGLGGFLPTYLSSALDGPVGIAAAAHVAQTLDREGEWSMVAHGLATSRLFSGTIAAAGCTFDGANLCLPSGPGLGVEIDEDSLQAYRI